jgi:hypothetical protein
MHAVTPRRQRQQNESPLTWAARNGSADVLQLLLGAGANIHGVQYVRQQRARAESRSSHHAGMMFFRRCRQPLDAATARRFFARAGGLLAAAPGGVQQQPGVREAAAGRGGGRKRGRLGAFVYAANKCATKAAHAPARTTPVRTRMSMSL